MAFKMNGKDFPSMLAIAKELGKSRIYRKDFEKYGIVEVDNAELEVVTTEAVKPEATKEVSAEAPKNEEVVSETKNEEPEKVEDSAEPIASENVEAPKNEEKAEESSEKKDEPSVEEPKSEEAGEEKAEKPKRSKMTEEEKAAKKAERAEKRKEKRRLAREEANKITPEMLEKAKELQTKAGYADIWEWAVDMKKKSSEEVYKLAESLGIEWNKHEVDRINRMHAVMAIRENMFPGEKRPRVRKSDWQGVPFAEIENICKVNKVEYPVTKDEKMTRVHMIRALKAAGIASPSN